MFTWTPKHHHRFQRTHHQLDQHTRHLEVLQAHLLDSDSDH